MARNAKHDNILLSDDKSITFGKDSDATIVHDGSNFYLTETTGEMIFEDTVAGSQSLSDLLAGGGGDPITSSNDHSIVRVNSPNALQDSGPNCTIDDSGNLTLPADASLYFEAGTSYSITVDGSNNLSFTDTITGTKTLAELAAAGTPDKIEEGDSYIEIVDTGTGYYTGQIDSNDTFYVNNGKVALGYNYGSIGTSAVVVGTAAQCGNQSVAIGSNSGSINTSTNSSVYVGYASGYNGSSAWGQTCLGYNSGSYSTSSSYNVIVGYNAGYQLANTVRGTFLGPRAGYTADNCDESVFIGNRAGFGATLPSTLIIENSDDLTNPLIYGEFGDSSTNKLCINTATPITSTTGLTVLGNIAVGDDYKLELGDSNDAYVQFNSASGELTLYDPVTGSITLADIAANTAHVATSNIHQVHPNPSTDEAIARYDGTTGALQSSSITIDDAGHLIISNDNDMIKMGPSAESKIYHSSSSMMMLIDTAEIQMRIGSNEIFSVISTGAQVQSDTKKLFLGNDQDLEVYHNGTNGYIYNNTGDLTFYDPTTGSVTLSTLAATPTIDKIQEGDSYIEVVDTGTGYYTGQIDGSDVLKITTTQVCIGSGCTATSGAVSIGKNCTSSAGSAITLGHTAVVSAGAVGGSQIVIGTSPYITAAGDSTGAIVIGGSAYINTISIATGAIVIGTSARLDNAADLSKSIIIGDNASGTFKESIVIGTGAASTQIQNIVIGKSASCASPYGIAMGGSAKAAQDSIALGRNTGSINIHNTVAIGSAAGNGSTSQNAVFLGPGAGFQSTSQTSVFIGYGAGYNYTSADNRLIIENSNDITNPLVYGEFGDSSTNKLCVNTSTPATTANGLTVNGTISAPLKTPASASDTGTQGEICWDANYIYVCVATNTWKRTLLSTW